MQHFLVKVDHYYFGWVLFAFTLVFYFWASKRIERRDETAPALPVYASITRKSAGWGAAFALVSLAFGPAWSAFRAMEGPPSSSVMPPPEIDGWVGPLPYDAWWHPVFAGADESFQASYRNGSGGEVALYRATYHSQRQGKELVGHRNSVVGERQRASVFGPRRVSVDGGTVEVDEVLATGWNGSDLLIWSTYAVDGRPDRMGLRSRLEYGLKSVFDFPAASIVAIAAECREGCESARESLGAFAAASQRALFPGIEQDSTVPLD
jgi:EpsI family protein